MFQTSLAISTCRLLPAILFALLALLPCNLNAEDLLTLDNSVTKIGIDRQKGGSITWLSSAAYPKNLVNLADPGRLIQQSYYAGKSRDRRDEGQSKDWSPWSWNPIQGGGVGSWARVSEFKTIDQGKTLYAETIPKLWDMPDEEAEARMRTWVTFEPEMPNVVAVRCELICQRDPNDAWGPAAVRSQEIPACYFTRNFEQMKSYLGDENWRNESQALGPPWGKTRPPLNAMAFFEAGGNGVAVFSPCANKHWNFGPHVGGLSDDPAAGPCMHVAPIAMAKLGPDSVYRYRYWLVTGDEASITTRLDELLTRYAGETAELVATDLPNEKIDFKSAAFLKPKRGPIPQPEPKPETEPKQKPKPNILFISVDDLNDHVQHLGGYPGKMITPNMDRLAGMGMTFSNAHCAAPICNPSRTATMFGVRPSTSGVYSNGQQYRQSPVLESALTLPEYLRKQHGYSAQGAGKIFHALEWINGPSDGYSDPQSWDSYWPSMQRQMPRRVAPDKMPLARSNQPNEKRGAPRHMDWGPIGHPSEAMPDHKVTDWAIDQLSRKHEKPFFIACGIFRPHIPWYVPQEYLDMYPLDEIQLPTNPEGWLEQLPESVRSNPAAGAKRRAWHQWIVKNDHWKQAVQGYLASVTYADMQVGRLLDAFEQSTYRDNTIVVLWSDHGAHLGDKETWEKYSLWHESTRVPLIFVAPKVTTAGTTCNQPASLLDIYPTLLELAGIPVPNDQLEGNSLVPQLKDPLAAKDPVVCTHEAGNHAVISDRYRYIRYADGAEELYDMVNDQAERNNLAGDPQLQAIQSEFSQHLPTINRKPMDKEPAGKANQ